MTLQVSILMILGRNAQMINGVVSTIWWKTHWKNCLKCSQHCNVISWMVPKFTTVVMIGIIPFKNETKKYVKWVGKMTSVPSMALNAIPRAKLVFRDRVAADIRALIFFSSKNLMSFSTLWIDTWAWMLFDKCGAMWSSRLVSV